MYVADVTSLFGPFGKFVEEVGGGYTVVYTVSSSHFLLWWMNNGIMVMSARPHALEGKSRMRN